MNAEWFKERKRAQRVTDAQLADALGVERSVANKVVNGKVEMNARRADAVATLLGSSRDEVLFHAGLSTQRPSLPDQQATRSSDGGETVEIIQLDLSLAMGPGTLIEDFVQSEAVAFDLGVLRRITRTDSARLRFITGIGTSHEPKFQSGDQFLIDINDRKLTRFDAYYWITFDGAHALKRLRPLGNKLLRVISENPAFEPMDLDANAVRIEGRAIWFARGL